MQGKDVQYSMSTLGQSSEVKSTTVSFCLTSVQDDVNFDGMTALAVNGIPVRCARCSAVSVLGRSRFTKT